MFRLALLDMVAQQQYIKARARNEQIFLLKKRKWFKSIRDGRLLRNLHIYLA
jgi:hypothetical protein